jgi:hypothetical protein
MFSFEQYLVPGEIKDTPIHDNENIFIRKIILTGLARR